MKFCNSICKSLYLTHGSGTIPISALLSLGWFILEDSWKGPFSQPEPGEKASWLWHPKWCSYERGDNCSARTMRWAGGSHILSLQDPQDARVLLGGCGFGENPALDVRRITGRPITSAYRGSSVLLHVRSVAQSCLTPYDPMDCCLSGSFVHGIF